MFQKIRVGIIGAGKKGTSFYKLLKGVEYIEIVSVCDISEGAPGIVLAYRDGIKTCNTVEELCMQDMGIIIETTGVPEVQQTLARLKASHTSVIEAEGANFIMHLVQAKEKGSQGKLYAILNSVQEAIEIAGTDGIIRYVNPAFSRVTGISAQQRIGKNIFEVSPESALARVLRTHEPIFSHRAKVGGCEVEVISNAAPIIVEGKIEACVVVFQPLTEIYKTMEQLQNSNRVITELQSRINQITTSSITFDDIIGSHPDFERSINLAKHAAKSDDPVLILGESGTGKELFAHAIHCAGKRSDKPFIKVNCAAIPETLLESELFGHEKGSFATASKTKIGKMELANEGTIFLDEMGDINLALQSKLLRVLQNMEFERVGGNQTIKVNVRVIAATNRNLREKLRQGNFSEELYYRLNGAELRLPPLRKHKDDILAYAQFYITKLNRKFGKHVVAMNAQAEQLLHNYDWPGNVRELQNVIERAMVIVEGDIITPQHLMLGERRIDEIGDRTGKDTAELLPLDVLEKKMIRLALERYGDSVEGKKKAAQTLNISLATLYNKIKTL